ncbi:MAG: ABC transporter permease [Oscillospiraceae bacterium]|jgi:ABC-2 type transport system permease protein|nr:ABC transporter permease [Oscillospiraceae bacterium]
MKAIYRRELGAYFTSSIGYVFLGVFYFYCGLSFTFSSLFALTYDMSEAFSLAFTALIFLIPILTMKLFSEEKKQRTEQCLLTAPISLPSMVLGKFFAALTLYTAGIAVYFIFAVILSFFAPAFGWIPVLSNFLALFLVGAAFTAIGAFISSLTENQVVAAVTSCIALMVIWLLDSMASFITLDFLSWLPKLLMSLSFYSKYAEFTSGIFNLSSVLFYISAVVIFLFLTVRVSEKRRWS